jgi:hypothetical protein
MRPGSWKLSVRTLSLVVLLFCGASSANALCVTNSDCMWPTGCGFTAASTAPLPFPTPALIRGLSFSNFSQCTPERPGGGYGLSGLLDVFFEVSLDGGAHWAPTFSDGLMQSALVLTSPAGANPRIYETLILQLDIDPPGGMFIRIASGNSSGETQILSTGGGQFRVDSFFDVFVELSLDGGRTFAAATQPQRMILGGTQPTPVRTSTWGALKSFYR